MKTRHCARAVIVNELREVLLVYYSDEKSVNPAKPENTQYWVPPGGGVEEGEPHETAVVREVEEETGLQNPQVEKWIWTRTHDLIHKGEIKTFIERYYLVHTIKADCPMRNRTADEDIKKHRWWSLEELRGSDELFFPEGFTKLLEAIIDNQLPDVPIDIEGE